MNVIETWDSKANKPENINDAVEAIGNSESRRLVFEAIYFHKKKVKTVQEIADTTGLTRKQVLTAGGHLNSHQIVGQTKSFGDTAYSQIRFYKTHKPKILGMIGRKDKMAKVPTKRNIGVTVNVKQPALKPVPQHHQITIDDIDSFKKVRKVKSRSPSLPASMSERQFNDSIKAILGDTGTFRDWGGENSDMLSSHLMMKGKRYTAAFGFKGPGTKGPLTIAKMGKNGNQMLRLFNEPARIFFVQHWREIKPDVLEFMELRAERKARTLGKPVWYCIIDGQDSNRLRLAYPAKFKR